MNDQTSYHLVAAGAHLLPALVWAIIARETIRSWYIHRPRATLFKILPILTTLLALHFVLHVIIELTPTRLDGRLPGLHRTLEVLIAVAIVASAPLFRHLVPSLPVHEATPTRRWLVLNYGSAALVGAVMTTPLFAPGSFLDRRWVVNGLAGAYAVGMLATGFMQAHRLAKRGSWRQGIAFSELRSADIAIIFIALVGVGVMLLAFASAGAANPGTSAQIFLHTAVGLALAIPFAVRMLGRMVRDLLLASGLIVATLALFVATRAIAARMVGPELASLMWLVGAATLTLVLGPGERWFRFAVDHLVFRHGRQRKAELQAVLDRLSPEYGAVECCRRALAELTRVMRFRGAAILLASGKGSVLEGDVALEGLERLASDPTVDALLPDRPLMEIEMRELPPQLRDALLAANVVRVFPIVSPRRRWGHVLATEALLAAPIDQGDVEAITGFLAQLALVLDGAELLAHATSVERSLAHAEKLAAIGELAARIAHEIRNPVTAARSLAQQLAAETTAPHQEEHRLILAELERVERQVAALLRFARRDEFHFEPVDLAHLVAATLDAFASRLEVANVGVGVELLPGVRARADREKLRQVLINLIENAIDALAEQTIERHLSVTVGNGAGCARLRIADSGPGVPAEALAQIFEPFFSLKEKGTGLGLAIAKRTIEAHGGRITAASSPGFGAAFEIELPLADAT
jgi:signal transduction histidine kinase